MLLKVFTQRLNAHMLDMLLYPGSKEWGMDKVTWKIPGRFQWFLEPATLLQSCQRVKVVNI